MGNIREILEETPIKLDITCDSMTVPIRVSTPVGKPLVVDRVYRSYLVSLAGYDTWVDLIILGMVDFDVILGMDWVSPYRDVLDCNAKTVTLRCLVFQGLSGRVLVVLILARSFYLCSEISGERVFVLPSFYSGY